MGLKFLLLPFVAGIFLAACGSSSKDGTGRSLSRYERYERLHEEEERKNKESRPDKGAYPTHLRGAYLLGYRTGKQDAQGGLSKNAARAFSQSGRGFEPYFKEGYEDGYAGRRPAH